MKQFPSSMKRNGFTLVELLIVLSIIGVFTSFATSNFIEVRMKARDAQRKSDILTIQTALEHYKSDNGTYPISTSGGTYVNNTPCGQTFSSGSTQYISIIPCDPLGTSSNYNNGNYYYYSADGSSYTLAGCLERKNDPQGQASVP